MVGEVGVTQETVDPVAGIVEPEHPHRLEVSKRLGEGGVGLVLLIWVRPTPAEFSLGLVAVILGAAMRTWGAGHLVKTLRLTVTGPYARMRHPLYVWSCMVAAWCCMLLHGAA